jgi:hypothetical protein
MKNTMKLVSLLLLLTALAGLLTFASAAATGAPVAENLELSTYRGVSVGGRLSATDPEGGALRYEVTTKPVKGAIALDDDGRFVYTPADGKRGKDYFGYQAIDPDGNRSQEATVIIRIEKQKSKVSYSDLRGNGSAGAAVRLAEEGVFCGEYLAGQYVFDPEHPVTREEFLAMCMKVSGAGVLTGVRSTGFADDADIAVWAKPYVSTALKNGVISGYNADGGAVFAPDRPVSMAEAAVMLDRAVGLTDAVSAWFAWDSAVPAWAAQSAANVASCGLLPDGCSFSDATLTRAQAAEMLCGVMDVLAKR